MPRIETDVNRPAVPPEGARITAEVDVEPGEQTGSVRRHVALCIDTSGSMGGAKIARARDGAGWVFGLLDPEDRVSVVSFDTSAEVVFGPTRWGDIDREVAISHVEELGAGGGTDMYEGVAVANESLHSPGWVAAGESGGEAEVVRRLLLLSDGKDEDHSRAEFEALAQEVDEDGVRIQAAGIGDDYNQDTIRTLGTTARGSWTHLEAPGDIEQFFGDAVEAASDVVAADAMLELDAADGVEVSEVYRALPQAQDVSLDWADNVATVKLPDLTERERQRVAMKVRAPPRETEGQVPLVRVTLRTRDGTATDEVAVEYTEDDAALAAANEEVQLDHRQTVVRTELGKGNVEAAETEVERMTEIHGETEVVEEARRRTEVVKKGGRAERSEATQVVDDDRVR